MDEDDVDSPTMEEIQSKSRHLTIFSVFSTITNSVLYSYCHKIKLCFQILIHLLFLAGNPGLKILWAAEMGKADLVSELLCGDASLAQATDADGYTPLHRASYEGHKHIVKVSTFVDACLLEIL